MGRRFLTTTALLDVTSLGLAIIVGIALIPDFGAGVKVAIMHQGELTEADSIGREVGPDDVGPVRALLQRHMPDANGRQLALGEARQVQAPLAAA